MLAQVRFGIQYGDGRPEADAGGPGVGQRAVILVVGDVAEGVEAEYEREVRRPGGSRPLMSRLSRRFFLEVLCGGTRSHAAAAPSAC
jgi:hypothetical protein